MFVEMINNGTPSGPIGEALAGVGYDPGYYRPYFDDKNRPSITVRTGETKTKKDGNGEPIYNAAGEKQTYLGTEQRLIRDLQAEGRQLPMVCNATTLRKDQWIKLDAVVIKAARQRLRAWSDLRAANTFGGFDGMATPILEHETMSDPGEAMMDMDGMTEGRNFAPQFQLEGLPLPITHSDFFLSSRFLAASRTKGTPQDTIRAELAGRRVAELIEQVTIGTVAGTVYGDQGTNYSNASKVYGYTTHPDRNTGSSTTPDGTNGPAILTNFLSFRDALYLDRFYGPFMVYTSDGYDQYLDNLFATAEPSAGTLRKRLLEVDGIIDIRRLDYLTTDYQTLWVQQTPDVARAINGMEITTLQWDSMGGMRLNFKVMGIQVPQLRSDYNERMGLLHSS